MDFTFNFWLFPAIAVLGRFEKENAQTGTPGHHAAGEEIALTLKEYELLTSN